MPVVLNRLSSDIYGTYGVILNDRKPLCHTYELPWLGNLQNESCIPVGEYEVIKAQSPRFGSCFYVKDVPDREGILIHCGNTRDDTEGCILPGLDVSDVGVIQSRLALQRLYSTLPSSFQLVIREA